MGANDSLGYGQWAQGLDWQDLCRGPLNIATCKINNLGWAGGGGAHSFR